MEVPKATFDHHNRKKTAVKIPGGGGAAIGAVLLLGGALATAAFVGRRCWNSGQDRRRLQDQNNGKQDGSFGATEASNVPKELSGATQDDNVAAVAESTQLGENPRVEIDGGTRVDGCDRQAVDQSLRPAVLGNDAVSAATNEDETLRFEAENMMKGDHVSDEVEIKEINNFVLVYDGDVSMKCEHACVEEKGSGELCIDRAEKCNKTEGHGSEEANGDATEEDNLVEPVVEDELVKEEENFGQGSDAVEPKDELQVAGAEGNTPCEEDIAVGVTAESPVVDEDEALMKSGLERSFDNKEAEEDLILPENVEDEVEEEGTIQVVEVEENNVVCQPEEDLILPENVEDEVKEEEPAQVVGVKENNVVGQPKQQEDNVERDTAEEVEKLESAIADAVAMRMTDHLSEIVEESSVKISDSCTDTQQNLPDVVVEESSVETDDSSIDDSNHSSEIVLEESSVETGIDSKSETIPPPEPLHMQQMVIREVEGKILEDAAEKTKAHGGDGEGVHTIPYSLPEKRLMAELAKLKTNPRRRAVAFGAVWLWWSWFFGMSLVKLCAIVALTMALSKIQGY